MTSQQRNSAISTITTDSQKQRPSLLRAPNAVVGYIFAIAVSLFIFWIKEHLGAVNIH